MAHGRGHHTRERESTKRNADLVRHGTSGTPQRLAPAARAELEPAFGQSFEQIHVYADEHAAESARALNADAYTVGSKIVFAPEQYDSESTSGRKLLAHELTHSIQQGALDGSWIPPAELDISDAASSIEAEAELASSDVARGAFVHSGSTSPAVIARHEDDDRQASFPDPNVSVAPPEYVPRSDPNAPVSFPGDVPGEPDPMADVPEHDPIGTAVSWLADKGATGLIGKLFGVPGAILSGVLGMESDETPAQREARKRAEAEGQ
jgi:hypothetical protein